MSTPYSPRPRPSIAGPPPLPGELPGPDVMREIVDDRKVYWTRFFDKWENFEGASEELDVSDAEEWNPVQVLGPSEGMKTTPWRKSAFERYLNQHADEEDADGEEEEEGESMHDIQEEEEEEEEEEEIEDSEENDDSEEKESTQAGQVIQQEDDDEDEDSEEDEKEESKQTLGREIQEEDEDSDAESMLMFGHPFGKISTGRLSLLNSPSRTPSKSLQFVLQRSLSSSSPCTPSKSLQFRLRRSPSKSSSTCTPPKSLQYRLQKSPSSSPSHTPSKSLHFKLRRSPSDKKKSNNMELSRQDRSFSGVEELPEVVSNLTCTECRVSCGLPEPYWEGRRGAFLCSDCLANSVGHGNCCKDDCRVCRLLAEEMDTRAIVQRSFLAGTLELCEDVEEINLG